MFYRSCSLLCMSVGVACRTMGFRTPPKDKKELKSRFLQLTKEHHPDQNADKEAEATQKMVEVTEAYRTLKKLHDNSGQSHATDMHGAVHAMQQRRGWGDTDATMAEVAASFVAPGASLSLHGFTLPWQRMATKSKIFKLVDELDRSRTISFGDYVTAVRAVEKERYHREEARKRDAKMSEGSHGFSAEYFEQLNNAKRQFRRHSSNGGGKDGESGENAGDSNNGLGTERDIGQQLPTGVVSLALRFYGRRLSAAVRNGPRKSWQALRYVVLGH